MTLNEHHKYTSYALRSAHQTVLDGDQLRRSYARPVDALSVIGRSVCPRQTSANDLSFLSLFVRRQHHQNLIILKCTAKSWIQMRAGEFQAHPPVIACNSIDNFFCPISEWQ